MSRSDNFCCSNLRTAVIARTRSSIATGTAAPVNAGLGRLNPRVGINRLHDAALGARAFGSQLALRPGKRPVLICGLRCSSSARLADFLAIRGAVCGRELVQRLDKTAGGANAQARRHVRFRGTSRLACPGARSTARLTAGVRPPSAFYMCCEKGLRRRR